MPELGKPQRSVPRIDYTVTDIAHGSVGWAGLADMSQGEGQGGRESGRHPSAMIIGQNERAEENPDNTTSHCLVVSYDPKRRTYSSTPIQCPVDPRTQGLSATRVGDSVLVFGGHIAPSDPTDPSLSPSYSRSLYGCSVDTHRWHQTVRGVVSKATRPKARTMHSAFNLGGRLYIVGGRREGETGLQDCWSFSIGSGRWHRERDCPVPIYGAAFVVVDGRCHLLGGETDPTAHLSFSEEGGWVIESPLPFSTHHACAIENQGDIILFGGVGHAGQTHTYHTETRKWALGETMPLGVTVCNTCRIGDRVLVHSQGRVLCAAIDDRSHSTRSTWEVLSRQYDKQRMEKAVLKATQRDKERTRDLHRQAMRDQKIESLLTSVSSSDTLPRTQTHPFDSLESQSSSLSRTLLIAKKHIVSHSHRLRGLEGDSREVVSQLGAVAALVEVMESRIDSLETQVQSLTETLASHSAAATQQEQSLALLSQAQCDTVTRLIERAKECETDRVPFHISVLQKHQDMARDLCPALSSLQRFLTEHPVEKVVGERCSELRRTLSDLLEQFRPFLQEVESREDDPVESVSALRLVTTLLSDIDRMHPVQMPGSTTGLSLGDKRSYFLAEGYNSDLRSVYHTVGPLIELQGDIESALAGMETVAVPDTNECQRVDTAARALHATLSDLAPSQDKALKILKRYNAMPSVTEKDVALALYHVQLQQVKATDPTLSRPQKVSVANELARLQKRLGSLQRDREERSRTCKELEQYVQFPQVATALSATGVLGLDATKTKTTGSMDDVPGEILRASVTSSRDTVLGGGWQTQKKRKGKKRRHG
ncbi:hypothetical protein KIPB_003445 [Kipferlia bialata]|uniref:Uncharacterized protein n=1 Tax=Kipferlia bialata TaxID=797122 RepID=A0A9K3CS66_9EUKA|nr:hypothetical protein KIPB_003445 [Kipferlia bialata]|eukprot:g3445.t1